MNIRNATIKDLATIVDIFNYEILNNEFVYIYEPWTLEYATTWFQEIKDNNFPFILIESANEILGYAYYTKFREREAYDSTVEYSVYIHRKHRKKGLAFQLVTRLIQLAKKEGYHVMVGGLDASNIASYNFHQRMGFTEVAHFKSIAKKNGKWLDLIFFQLMLND